MYKLKDTTANSSTERVEEMVESVFTLKIVSSTKIRKDIVNFEPDIEQIWIALTYRNKNSSVLIGVFYQDSFNSTSKTEWLGKFDAIMGQVLMKWDSTVIL